MKERSNLVYLSMVQCLETRIERIPFTGPRFIPSEGEYKICLNRQCGHTTDIIDFMVKYHNRCVLLVLNHTEKFRLQKEYGEKLRTNSDFIFTINELHDNRSARGTGKFIGKDIIIIDCHSYISQDQNKQFIEIIEKFPSYSRLPITAVFKIQ